MTPAPQITRAEWRWALGWALVVLAVSTAPLVVAALVAPAGWSFGGLLVNPVDGHTYLAKMAQGSAGSWLFHLPFTHETHDGAFIFTFYLALGHLSRLSSLPPVWVFHLARLAAGLFLLTVTFRFIADVTPHPRERRLAFALVISAAGLGWLGVLLGAFPIDLWVPEAFVPYSIYANPHFPLAIALMVLIFQQILSSLRENALQARRVISVGLSGLLLAMILPFGLLTTWAVLGAFLLWRFAAGERRLPVAQIWLTLSTVLFSLPVVAYQYWVSRYNPALAGWSAQNLTPAPSLLNLALGYGLVGLLAVAGGWTIIRNRRHLPAEWLTLCWAVVTVTLVYLPFALQRRLITGLHVPLCILAALGLARWIDGLKLAPWLKGLIPAGVIAVSALGTLFVWSLPLIGALQSPDSNPTTALLFLQQDEQATLTWLREYSQPNDVILASPRLSLFVPEQTGARVVYGHPFETLDAKRKLAEVEAFYRGDAPPPGAATLALVGPPDSLAALKLPAAAETVFTAGEVRVVRLR